MPQRTQCRSCKRRHLSFPYHLMQLLWYAIGSAAAGEPCLESLESICHGVRYCDVRRCTGDTATASVCSSWHSESGSDPDPRTVRVNNGRSGRSDISRDIDRYIHQPDLAGFAAATQSCGQLRIAEWLDLYVACKEYRNSVRLEDKLVRTPTP